MWIPSIRIKALAPPSPIPQETGNRREYMNYSCQIMPYYSNKCELEMKRPSISQLAKYLESVTPSTVGISGRILWFTRWTVLETPIHDSILTPFFHSKGEGEGAHCLESLFIKCISHCAPRRTPHLIQRP